MVNVPSCSINSRQKGRVDIWWATHSLCQFSSVQSLSRVRLFATPWIEARQAPCPSPAPGVHSNSCPSSRWCHLAISSSVIPCSSCPQSLPASRSFPMSQFRWSKDWNFSFSISPSNDYSGLISFRIDWFALLAVQGSVNHLQALLSKSLIQFFADGWGCVPSLSFGLRPNYWSFSFSNSPSNEYSGLIPFRIDWLNLLAVQGTLKSLQNHSSKESVLQHSAFFIVQLSHPHWKNHSFD